MGQLFSWGLCCCLSLPGAFQVLLYEHRYKSAFMMTKLQLWQWGVYSSGSECSHFSSLFCVPCKITRGRAWLEDGSSFSWHLLILFLQLMFAKKFQSLKATKYVLHSRASTGHICTSNVFWSLFQGGSVAVSCTWDHFTCQINLNQTHVLL